MTQNHEDILRELQELQNHHELSIIKISEPISSALTQAPGARTSDVSADGLSIPTPSSLEEDLTHYKVRQSKSHRPH
jgi:hypothetical protein